MQPIWLDETARAELAAMPELVLVGQGEPTSECIVILSGAVVVCHPVGVILATRGGTVQPEKRIVASHGAIRKSF